MNLKNLSEKILESALTQGEFCLDGEVRKVTTAQILQLARDIVMSKLVIEQESEEKPTAFPEELWSATREQELALLEYTKRVAQVHAGEQTHGNAS